MRRRLCRVAAAAPCPSVERHDRFDRDVGPQFLPAVGQRTSSRSTRMASAQAEVHAQVVLRIVAAAAAYFLHLRRAARGDAHARADRAAIRRDAHELQRQPVPSMLASIEAEEVRRVVDVVDEHVDVAVVVEVGERGAAAGFRSRSPAVRAVRVTSSKRPLPQVAVDDLALLVARLGLQLLDFRIDVAVHEEEIEPAVVDRGRGTPTPQPSQRVLRPKPLANVRSSQRPLPVLA